MSVHIILLKGVLGMGLEFQIILVEQINRIWLHESYESYPICSLLSVQNIDTYFGSTI